LNGRKIQYVANTLQLKLPRLLLPKNTILVNEADKTENKINLHFIRNMRVGEVIDVVVVCGEVVYAVIIYK